MEIFVTLMIIVNFFLLYEIFSRGNNNLDSSDDNELSNKYLARKIYNKCSELDLSCGSAYSWVYSTSYWTGTAYDPDYIWYVNTDTYFRYTIYLDTYDLGVRPVITISKDYL